MRGLHPDDIRGAGTSLANLLIHLTPPGTQPGSLVLPVLAEALAPMLAQVSDQECDRLMRAFVDQVARQRAMLVAQVPSIILPADQRGRTN